MGESWRVGWTRGRVGSRVDQGKGLRRVGQGRGGWVEIRVDQTRDFLLKNMTLLF